MPAYKHPCPHCGGWISRDVAACPFCGTADPFAPARCASCRAVIEDPGWTTCPKCGQSLTPALAPAAAPGQVPAPAPPAAAPAALPGPTATPAPVTQAPPPAPAPGQPVPAARSCTGCGAPLPAGARFCQVCGTLAV